MSRVGLFSSEGWFALGTSRSALEVRLAEVAGAHFDFVWRLLRRNGLTPADADDTAQQVFMVLARRLESIEPGNERSFLYGTSRRVLANFRRGVQRRREVESDELEDMTSSEPLPDELVEQQREIERLDRLLERMPDPLRRALVLAELEGASTPEIAELEGIPTGTAASRLRRARALLHALLADADPGAQVRRLG